MTYQFVINRLKEIINAHPFIHTYGYGNLSDIAVPETKEAPDYPYAFINPIQTSVTNKSFSATFNLIVMTQVLDNEDDELFGQSNCMKYINDILSQFVLTNNDPLMSVSFPVNMTPFKERFQDDVVGATAVVTMSYGKPMSVCDSPITGLSPSEPYCPQTLVVDGDGSNHFLDAGDSYTCLPATAKEGIFYQRVIPWDNYRTDDPENSVGWLRRYTDTYDYTPPENPKEIAALANGYAGTDANCLLAQDNSFGNRFRYTDRLGNQYVEHFGNDNPQGNYCIDHLTGLGIYVDVPQQYENYTWAEAIDAAVAFTGEGYDDWRLADINEYLTILNYNDLVNAWGTAYTPWMNERLRQYGARFWLGCRNNDGDFNFFQTNGATIGSTTSTTLTMNHSLKVRNHFW
jgi:hypothetical protein